MSQPNPLATTHAPPAQTGEVLHNPPPRAGVVDTRRKAAMIVQVLLGGGQRLALSRLPEDTQIALTHEIAKLRLVDRVTLDSVATEFAQALERIGMANSGGVEATLASLSGQISAGAQARLRRELAASHGIDPWTAVIALPVPELTPIMHRESVEVAAVALSKLPVPKAAEVLAKLPGERARAITHAMSVTRGIKPETVTQIGHALVHDYATPPDTAFEAPPEDRLSAILNSTGTGTREALLQSLDAVDAGFAQNVRRKLFTFADLPQRLNPLDVPRLLRGVPQEDVVTALTHAQSGSPPEVASAAFILANLSQRMADALREAMSERDPPRKAEGEKACALLLANLRERQLAGEITLLPLPDEEE